MKQKLLLLLAIFATSTHAAEYRLYFLGGQSNMDGYGHVSELPDSYRESVHGVRIYHGQPVQDGFPIVVNGTWAPLQQLSEPATQEPITSFELQFIRLSQWGQEEHVYTVDLHDARIRSIEQLLPSTRAPDAATARLHEVVSFTYSSIELRWELGQGLETASVPWP